MTARRPNYKWELLLILSAAQFLNQGGQQIYAAVLPLIKADLKLSDVELGLVATVFIVILAVSAPVGGCLGDLASKKWLVFLSVLMFSAGILLAGFSVGLFSLIAALGLGVGIGVGLYLPNGNALIGQYHRGTRSLALSVHHTAIYAGIVTSSRIAGLVGKLHGWRVTFHLFGTVGLLLAAVVAWRVRNERRDGEMAKAERVPMKPMEVLGPVLRTPTFYFLSVAFGAAMFGYIGWQLWMPTLLYEKFHLSLKDAAFYAVVYHLGFAFLGLIAGGRISDRLAARRKSIRMEVAFLGLLLSAPFIWMLGTCSELKMVYAALAAFGFFRGLYDSNTIAALFDVIAPRYRSSATGLMIWFALVVSAASPLLLGYVKQRVDLGTGISWLAIMDVFAAAVTLVALKTFFVRDYVADSVT